MFSWTGLLEKCNFYSLALPFRCNANRAIMCRINRRIYGRTYPVDLVYPNGGFIRIRFHEPRVILQIPVDLDNCSPEERQKRFLRRHPRSKLTLQEQLEDTFDQEAYDFLLRKK
uniref:SJCHGC03170 protein n=1 Tax=Schistosoma japonicum TaxID=6182 RepID=Q5DAI0_SCHJA|nr:SJCHGC03170 protein [Schistosoma japonicum]